MDLAIRIEMYKNFAIMPQEKPLLQDIPCLKEAAAEKEAYEEDKVPTKKDSIRRVQKKYICGIK